MSSKESQFFKELYSIPIIQYSAQIGANLYYNLKKFNPYVETTLSTTEDLVVCLSRTCSFQKVAQTIEMPLSYVDKLASDGLQLLEAKYPSIRITPEDLKDEAMKKMVVLKGVGAQKLDIVVHEICRRRRHGMDRALHYLETMVSPHVSIYIDILEKSIDDYLPPIESVNTSDVVVAPREEQRVLARMAYIPRTVQDRLVQRYHQYVLRVTWTDAAGEANHQDSDHSDHVQVQD